MSKSRNLPWGEKHLCGDFYTIKISLGYNLWEKTKDKFKDLNLTVMAVSPSKKYKMPRYIAYGVLNQDDFMRYLNIKQEAQAELLVGDLTKLVENIKGRKERLKHNETIKGVRIVEPITLG